MQRYDHKLNYIGTGEYVSDMEPSDSGEFYLASDVDALVAKLRGEVEDLRSFVDEMRIHVKAAAKLYGYVTAQL